MSELDQLLSFIPEAWRGKVALAVMVSPYITRGIYSLMNGRGLKGLLASIWLGTNTPAKAQPATNNPPTP